MKNETVREISRRVALRNGAALVILAALGLPGAMNAQAGKGPYVVLLGAPGAGKSTHAAYISKQYGVPVVDAAGVLEDAIEDASKYTSSPQKNAAVERIQKARRALASLRQGELVNDENLNGMVASRISQADARDGFVIDGYPNTSEQAVFLDSYLSGQKNDKLVVIYLDIPDEVALARMRERARTDDVQGFGKERLDQFRTTIGEVLSFYEGGKLLKVDTTAPQADVQKEIDAFIKGAM